MSSSTTASYQDLIGFADKMAKAMNFKEGFGLSGFVGWIYGAFPLSFSESLEALGPVLKEFSG